MKKLFFYSFLFLSLVACSKKHEAPSLKYTVEEFNALNTEAYPSGDKGEDAIKLSDYSPGVNRLDSKGYIYKRLVFLAVEFETEEQAKAEAMRLNQYYIRNWLFDRVEGEPILEDYVITHFKAINPNRKIQRKPKVEAHGEGHGEAAHGEVHGEAHSEHH